MKKKIIDIVFVILCVSAGIWFILFGVFGKINIFDIKLSDYKTEHKFYDFSDNQEQNVQDLYSVIKEKDKEIQLLNKKLLEKQNKINELLNKNENTQTRKFNIKSKIEDTNIPDYINKFNSENMVEINAGDFVYGHPDSEKKVYLDTFYIDVYEVSNKHYKKFNSNHTYLKENADKPVIGITYYEALAYAKWRGCRLPTEQEWEKAARGFQGNVYPWGNQFDSEYCNTLENHNFDFVDVKSFEKGRSPFGIYNMSGNVWEWTSTKNADKYIIKGGSCLNDKTYAKTYSKMFLKPETKNSAVGFRCVRDE
jgi:iron(II)-dependent oxidoreductase